MTSDPLYLQALRGEREEQVARHRREQAGLRAAFARLVQAVRPSRRPASVGARPDSGPGAPNTTAS
jgi:hypothetical protein